VAAVPIRSRSRARAIKPTSTEAGWRSRRTRRSSQGTLTVALDCPAHTGFVRLCGRHGPIANTTVVNNHRCSAILTRPAPPTAIARNSTLQLQLRLTAPLSSGGVPVCVTNIVDGRSPARRTRYRIGRVDLRADIGGLPRHHRRSPARGAAAPVQSNRHLLGVPRDGMVVHRAGTSCAVLQHPASIFRRPWRHLGNLNSRSIRLRARASCSESTYVHHPPVQRQGVFLPLPATGERLPRRDLHRPDTAPAARARAGPFDQFCSIQTFRAFMQATRRPLGVGQLPGNTVVYARGPDRRTRPSPSRLHDAPPDTRIRTTTLASTFCIAAT